MSPGPPTQPPGEEPGSVAVGDEADVVAVRFLCHRQPALRGLDPDVGLERVAEWEQRVLQLGLGQYAEHVGLVLAGVDRAVQLDAVAPVAAAARSGRCRPRRSPARSARSRTAANLIFSLQRRQGLGVRPAAYSATKSSTTSAANRSRQVPDVERDSRARPRPAARRGRPRGEQQPRAPERNDCGFLASARCTPVTSWPASTARAAATAESTPPDMAAEHLSWAAYAIADGPPARPGPGRRLSGSAATSASTSAWVDV